MSLLSVGLFIVALDIGPAHAHAVGCPTARPGDPGVTSYPPPTRVGTSGNDSMGGTAGTDCIVGRGGNDSIGGFAGDDYVRGGPQNDSVDGGDGSDHVGDFHPSAFSPAQDTNEEGGNDALFGGNGDDELSGGTGNDSLFGGAGMDQLFGGPGFDSCWIDAADPPPVSCEQIFGP